MPYSAQNLFNMTLLIGLLHKLRIEIWEFFRGRISEMVAVCCRNILVFNKYLADYRTINMQDFVKRNIYSFTCHHYVLQKNNAIDH